MVFLAIRGAFATRKFRTQQTDQRCLLAWLNCNVILAVKSMQMFCKLFWKCIITMCVPLKLFLKAKATDLREQQKKKKKKKKFKKFKKFIIFFYHSVSFQDLKSQAENGSLPLNYPAQGARTVAEWQTQTANKRNNANESVGAASSSIASNSQQFARVRDLLEREVSVRSLVEAQTGDDAHLAFVAVVVVSVLNGIEFSKPTKAKLLAAAWARRDFDLADFLLVSGGFGLTEVLRAAKLLDGQRQLRALEARLAKLRDDPKVKETRRSQLREKIGELNNDAPYGSLPGSLKKRIRTWARTRVTAAQLTLESLGMPVTAWRELADIVHLGPSDFALDWFSAYVFSGQLPDGEAKQFSELVAARTSNAASVSNDAVVSRLLKLRIPYVAMRANAAVLGVEPLPMALRAHIASYEELETLIWHYENLACSEANESIQRLLAVDGVTLPFALGKLLERAIVLPSHLRPALLALADTKIHSLSLPLASPVLVMGDASNSMDVAIRVSTILAGVGCNLCDATLRFFNDKAVVPSSLPHSASAIVDMAMHTKATGLTACAAGLYDFYIDKTYFKTIILVSDEIENEQYKGEWFPTLFAKYRAEVNPDVQLALVSFRDSLNLGRIHSALLRLNIDAIALSLSAERPDSSRVDTLLAKLAQFSPGWSDLLARSCLAVKNEINSGRAAGSAVELMRAQLVRSAPAPAAAAASPKAAPAAPASNDDDDDAEDNDCVVCEERRVEMAFSPCGHFVSCAQCAVSLKECPMCRNAIRDKVKIYKK
jgi:hypothetical protein